MCCQCALQCALNNAVFFMFRPTDSRAKIRRRNPREKMSARQAKGDLLLVPPERRALLHLPVQADFMLLFTATASTSPQPLWTPKCSIDFTMQVLLPDLKTSSYQKIKCDLKHSKTPAAMVSSSSWIRQLQTFHTSEVSLNLCCLIPATLSCQQSCSCDKTIPECGGNLNFCTFAWASAGRGWDVCRASQVRVSSACPARWPGHASILVRWNRLGLADDLL